LEVFVNLTLKQPSPSTKPDIQLGSGTIIFWTLGLIEGTTSGKAALKSSDKPLFNTALIDTIFFLNLQALNALFVPLILQLV